MSDAASEVSSRTLSTTLLCRVQAREPAAWERLVLIYGPLIYEWARRAGLEPNNAADIVQETLRSVFISVGAFRRDGPEQSFRGWLWTIARNKIRDRARREHFHGGAQGGSSAMGRFLDVADEASLSEASSSGAFNLARRVLDLLRTDFEEKTWQAFWQTTVEGRRPDVVAESLGLKVSAVYNYKSRVLRRLRTELAAEL